MSGGRCLDIETDRPDRHFKSSKKDRHCQTENLHSDWEMKSFLFENHYSPLICYSTLFLQKSLYLLCCYSLSHSPFITFCCYLRPAALDCCCSNSYWLPLLSLLSHLNSHRVYFEHYLIVQNHCRIVILKGPQNINWTMNIRACQG